MDMFILIFVLSFISVIGACIFHWWKERLKNKDTESVNYVKDSRHSYGFTKEKAERISIAKQEAYLKQHPSIADYVNGFKFEEENTISKELKVASDIVSKWKQSTPKHKKRIQNRNKRKQRNK